MNLVRSFTRGIAMAGLIVLIGFQFGCAAPSATSALNPSGIDDGMINTQYRPGDKVSIDFLDNPAMPQNWQQTVREDGTITLPQNQQVVAAGKKKGELEAAIHELFVPRLLKRLTVNVRADERSYFVRGEVKAPGQRPHTGSITALKAIAAAGDFTDFANRRRVEIIRANGEKIMMNGKDAIKNPAKDVPVYPGDVVFVHRRYF